MSSYVYLGVRTLAVIVLVAALWPILGDVYDGLLLGVAGIFLPSGMQASAIGGQVYFEFSSAAPDSGIYVQGLLMALGLALGIAVVLCTPAMRLTRKAVSLAGMLAVIFLLHAVGVTLLARGLWLAMRPGEQTFTINGVLTSFAIFWALLPAILVGIWCYLYWLPQLKAEPDRG